MKLSGNVAFPTMLQSVASLKIENCNQFLIFFLSAKTFKIVDRNTQEGGGGVHSRRSFCPQCPLPMARSASLLRGLGRK